MIYMIIILLGFVFGMLFGFCAGMLAGFFMGEEKMNESKISNIEWKM